MPSKQGVSIFTIRCPYCKRRFVTTANESKMPAHECKKVWLARKVRKDKGKTRGPTKP